ncbi:MAG: flagellar biosynthetic protein FliQ [Bdellovibrionales bacterium]|nr:flagellar biosynthetic protein FliQ [Bdellovibrionales bacterium]
MAIAIEEAFWLVVILSGLPLLVSSFFCLSLSVLQAATQVQEQTIGFIIRFISVSCILGIFGPWYTDQLVEYLQKSISSFRYLGQLP